MAIKVSLKVLDVSFNRLARVGQEATTDGKFNYDFGKTLRSINEEVDAIKEAYNALLRAHGEKIASKEGERPQWQIKFGQEDAFEEAWKLFLKTEVEIFGQAWMLAEFRKLKVRGKDGLESLESHISPAEWAALLGFLVVDENEEALKTAAADA